MGLQNRERATYLSFNADGKFVQKVQSTTPGAIGRINKLNKQVYEIFHDQLVGKITDVQLEDSEYGLQWKVSIIDNEDERFIVTMGFISNYAKGFLKMFPKIDLSKPVTLSPASKEEDGDKKVSLFIYQEGKLVPYAFTKDVPNGMPDRSLLKDPKTGKDVWSYVDQMKWLSEQAARHLGKESLSVVKAEPVEKETTLDDIANTPEQPAQPSPKKDDF